MIGAFSYLEHLIHGYEVGPHSAGKGRKGKGDRRGPDGIQADVFKPTHGVRDQDVRN